MQSIAPEAPEAPHLETSPSEFKTSAAQRRASTAYYNKQKDNPDFKLRKAKWTAAWVQAHREQHNLNCRLYRARKKAARSAA